MRNQYCETHMVIFADSIFYVQLLLVISMMCMQMSNNENKLDPWALMSSCSSFSVYCNIISCDHIWIICKVNFREKNECCCKYISQQEPELGLTFSGRYCSSQGLDLFGPSLCRIRMMGMYTNSC